MVTIVAVIGAGAFVSPGCAIAAVSKSAAVSEALMNVVETPMMFLRGISFCDDQRPAWIRPVVNVMPLKYLAEALRSVIIDDASLGAVRWDLAILVAVTGVSS